MVDPQEIVAKECCRLLVAQSIVDQNKSISILDQKTPGGNIDHIVGICGIGLVPNGFWDHTEHGTPVQFKISGLYGINCHLESKMACKIRKARPK